MTFTPNKIAALFTAVSFVYSQAAYGACAGNDTINEQFESFSGMAQKQQAGLEGHRDRIFAQIKNTVSADDLAILQRDSGLPEDPLFSDGLSKANSVLSIANMLKEEAIAINDGDQNIKCNVALGLERLHGALITGYIDSSGNSAVTCEPEDPEKLSLTFSTSGMMMLCLETEKKYDTGLYTERYDIALDLKLRSCTAERYYEGSLDLDEESTRAEGAVIYQYLGYGNEIDYPIVFEPDKKSFPQYSFDLTSDDLDLMKSEIIRIIHENCQP